LDFSWTLSDTCPVTGPAFPLSDWTFRDPFWSTFTPDETPVSEPFAIFAYGPDDHVAYLPFAGLSRGHSLGSTLAILLARLACYAGISVTKILHDNQGSPKGGREVQGVLRRPGSADLPAGEHL
jgi:hypothetical protein